VHEVQGDIAKRPSWRNWKTLVSRNLSPHSAGSAEQKPLEQPDIQVADLDSLLDDLQAIISLGRSRAAAAINSEMVAT
jgi:hypothetical protein